MFNCGKTLGNEGNNSMKRIRRKQVTNKCLKCALVLNLPRIVGPES